MWLINSSIGRKVVMSLTGIALILFMTFHASMNVVALFSGDAYNMICKLWALIGMLLSQQLHWVRWQCVTLFMHLSLLLKTEEHVVQSVMR